MKAVSDLTCTFDSYGMPHEHDVITHAATLLKVSRVTNSCLCIIGHVAATSELKARQEKVRNELTEYRTYVGYDESSDFPDSMRKLIQLSLKEKKITGA